MTINYSELKKKEVIDVATGANLGKIIDLVIEEKSGKILCLIVQGRKTGFLSCENEELNYECITRIGDDAILYKKCHPRIREDDCELKERLNCDYDND